MRITVLGATEVEGTDPPLSPRDRTVLAALVVSGTEAISVDQLADALWGEEPPKSGTKVLQGSIVRLRRTLGQDAIETSSNGYRLRLDGEQVDAHAFEGLVVRARDLAVVRDLERAATAYLEALALWRGTPLPELQDWDPGRAEAARLLEIRRSVEEELVEVRLESGRTAQGLADARNLVTREPYREHRWALLALALYRSGRQREALAALRHARSTLVDELGLDPGPELTDLEARILRQDPALLDVPEQPAAASAVCPYPGLRAYDEDRAELFVGREQVVESALRRLDQQPLLVVVGASGSGKSSLARAGIAAAETSSGRTVRVLSPGAAPAASLAAVLTAGEPPDLLVVDQLEELFAGSGREAAEDFLDRLTVLAESGRHVVVTLRADYLAELSVHPAFAGLAERGLLLLTPMTEEELRRAVELPARRSGLVLEHGLVDLLMRDVVDESGGLPLLSHALAETWAKRVGNVMTVEAYNRTGGIRGAVAQSAERLYDSLPPEDRDVLRSVLGRLIVPAASGDPVPTPVPVDVFASNPQATRLLDLLVRSRLVTMSEATVALAHESLVRAWPRLRAWLEEDVESGRALAHLQGAAAGWAATGRTDDELYRGARLAAVTEWRDRDAAILSPTEVEFLDASLALAGREESERQARLDAERRRNRSLRLALGTVVGLLVLSLVAGSLAAISSRRAAESSAVSVARSLGSAALVEPRADTALLLARQAVALADDPVSQSALLGVLLRTDSVVSTGQTSNEVVGWKRDDQVSPDGTRMLVNEGVDRHFNENYASTYAISPSLLDTASGRTVTGQTLAVPQAGSNYPVTYGAGFVDGGRTVLVSRVTHGGEGGELELVPFSAADGSITGPAELLPDSLVASYHDSDYPRVSPDGSTVVAVTNHILRVWHRDVANRRWIGPTTREVPGLPPTISEFDTQLETRFSDDGRRVAILLSLTRAPFWANVDDGLVFDTRTLASVGPPLLSTPQTGGAETGELHSPVLPTTLAISPDGSTLAVGSLAGFVDLHDLDHPSSATLRIPGAIPVTALSWGHDGRRLAVGDNEGAATVYDVSTLQPLARFPGAGVALRSVSLPGSTDRAVSLDSSGHLTVRQLTPSGGLRQVVATARTTSVAAGPAGSVVAVGGLDGKVVVYDQRTLELRLTLDLGPYTVADPTDSPSEHRRVTALAITPDGGAVIAADRVGHLREWSTRDGSVRWSRDDVPTTRLAVSPDGRYLATLGYLAINSSGSLGNSPGARFPDSDPVANTLTVWDVDQHRTAYVDHFFDATNYGNLPDPQGVAFSADSSMLAVALSGTSGRVETFDTGSWHSAAVLPSLADATGITFGAAGDELFVRRFSGTVTGVSARSGQVLETFQAPEPGDAGMVASADGRWIVASTSTGIEVWDSAQHRLQLSSVPMPTDSTGGALSLATSADDVLYVATRTNLVRIDMSPAHWAARACAVAGRVLTRDEWSRYLPAVDYAPACSDPDPSTVSGVPSENS